MDSNHNNKMDNKLNDKVKEHEMLRGKTPEDIKTRCLQLCKDYLAGNWSQQTVDTIRLDRISGGLTNQLYYCAIADPSPDQKVPQEVAIRLYGKKWFNVDEHSERLTDTVVSVMVSEKGLGPKIYGLFDDGQIQHFYRHRQFKIEEQKDPILVRELFQKIAQIHAMDVPLPKKHWMFEEMDRFYNETMNTPRVTKLLEEGNCQTLLKGDFKDQIDWLKGAVNSANSPLVFAHNDLLSSNILVLEDFKKSGERLVLCDYEYAGYGHRGLDLGTVISEWGRLWTDIGSEHIYPNDSEMIALIDIYIEQSVKLLGKSYSQNVVNSREQLLKEVKLFGLVYKLFLILLFLKPSEDNGEFPVELKDLVIFAEKEYQNYWSLKKTFQEQNVFK